MSQPAFAVDQLAIAPGEAGTRTIQRDALAGALAFTDPVAGTLLLSQLAGLQNIGGVLLVGKTGAGAQYTAIQDALDAVPSTASLTNPYVILVMPGVYTETLTLVKDGVLLFGLGYVKVAAGVNDHTLTIQAGTGTTPRWAEFHGLTFANSYDGQACLRVIGAAASNVALSGFRFFGCGFEATAGGGNYPVWATSCGPLWFTDCSLPDNGLALIYLLEVLGFSFNGVNLPALSYRYNTSQDIPAGTYAGFRLRNCVVGASSTLNPVLDLNLIGGGSGIVQGNRVAGNVRVQGNQALTLTGDIIGNLSVEGTSWVTADKAPTGTETVAVGAKYSTGWRWGTATFGGDATKAVTFGFDFGTVQYDVSLELNARPVNDETPWVTTKLATGFTINFHTAQALQANWVARRR